LQQPNHKLRPAEIDALVADYAAGMDLTELGNKYDLHRQTAKAHLERRGVVIRSELAAMEPAQVAAAAQLYASGLSLKAVGAAFEVAPMTLNRYLRKAGVVIRPRGYAGPRPSREAR
jgi:lambda repressor-like predicted transcriptional regulator